MFHTPNAMGKFQFNNKNDHISISISYTKSFFPLEIRCNYKKLSFSENYNNLNMSHMHFSGVKIVNLIKRT
jgi:hypothetical protein